MWTLHVEDFGKIESADITVSPLTLFVGDNNSGKSYLLSLLYGLMRADDVLSNLCESSPEYQACAEWAEGAILRESEQAPFENTTYDMFERLFNRILQENRLEILQSIFHKNVSAGKISVEFQREENQVLNIYNELSDFFEANFPLTSHNWILHIFEFTKSQNTKRWKDVVNQFSGGVVRAYAIAGVLRIAEFSAVYLHFCYRKDKSNLVGQKPLPGRPAPRDYLKAPITLDSYPELDVKNKPIELNRDGYADIRLHQRGVTRNEESPLSA